MRSAVLVLKMKKEIALWISNKMTLLCELFDIDMYALIILTIILGIYLLAVLPEIKQENLIRLRTRLSRIFISCARLLLFFAELIWNYLCIPVYRGYKRIPINKRRN